jgi:hypothetical protein
MDKSLVYLDGGPLDGKTYSVEALFGPPEKLPGIEQYEFTQERRRGRGGKSAQVWRFKEIEVN